MTLARLTITERPMARPQPGVRDRAPQIVHRGLTPDKPSMGVSPAGPCLLAAFTISLLFSMRESSGSHPVSPILGFRLATA